MNKHLACVTLLGTLLAVGCGDSDRDAFNDVVLPPTATSTTSTTTSTRTSTSSNTGTSTGTSTTSSTSTTSAPGSNVDMLALSGDSTTLLRFNSSTPAATTPVTLSPTNPLDGSATGDTLVGLTVRPQNNQVYALATHNNGGTLTVTLYLINPATGYAGRVNIDTGTAFTDATAQNLLNTATSFGVDFNPAVDAIRVVTDTGLNFRVNPNTGAVVDADTGTAGLQLDTNITPNTLRIGGASYTNSVQNATATTLYTLDADGNSLNIQTPPNAGTQSGTQTLPFDFTAVQGFDIPASVTVATSNTAATAGTALAALRVNNLTGLYAINLVNGNTTSLGNVGAGANLRGACIAPPTGSFPLVGLSTDGTQLLRFNSAAPNTATSAANTVTVTGITAGERLVGVDYRPNTGQLYALGINTATNAASLYLANPQTGAVTVVGAAGGIAFIGAPLTPPAPPVQLPIAFPDPTTDGYGFDFNPAADRIRVVAGSLNFRVNPNTGAPVDGDSGGAAGSVAGTNPDGSINGATTTVSAAAYTNSFAQLTPSPATGATTLYLLDEVANTLVRSTSPNGGTTASPLPLGVDFNPFNGFTITSDVVAATSNAAVVSGSGFALLNAGAGSSLYRVDLTTGTATLVGATPVQLSGLAGY